MLSYMLWCAMLHCAVLWIIMVRGWRTMPMVRYTLPHYATANFSELFGAMVYTNFGMRLDPNTSGSAGPGRHQGPPPQNEQAMPPARLMGPAGGRPWGLAGLGRAWLGSGGLGWARLGAWPGTAGLGWAWLGWARLGLARLG